MQPFIKRHFYPLLFPKTLKALGFYLTAGFVSLLLIFFNNYYIKEPWFSLIIAFSLHTLIGFIVFVAVNSVKGTTKLVSIIKSIFSAGTVTVTISVDLRGRIDRLRSQAQTIIDAHTNHLEIFTRILMLLKNGDFVIFQGHKDNVFVQYTKTESNFYLLDIPCIEKYLGASCQQRVEEFLKKEGIPKTKLPPKLGIRKICYQTYTSSGDDGCVYIDVYSQDVKRIAKLGVKLYLEFHRIPIDHEITITLDTAAEGWWNNL